VKRLFRHLFTLLSMVSLLLCMAVSVLWVRSYRSPEPTIIPTLAEGGTEYGSRQGYFFLTIQEPLPTQMLNSPGSVFYTASSHPFPGVEREVMPFTSTTRVRCWLVAMTSTGVFLVGLLATLMQKYQKAARMRRNLCPICGYDLRASPERCPECGTVTQAKATA
jgi:hypothetical protein